MIAALQSVPLQCWWVHYAKEIMSTLGAQADSRFDKACFNDSTACIY